MIYITNCRKGSEIWCGWAGWSCLDKQSWQKMRVVDMCIRQREEPIQKLSLSGKHRTFCELHTRFLVGESVKWRGACWRWVQGWGGPSTAPHGEDMRRWHNRLIIFKRLSCLFFPLEKKKCGLRRVSCLQNSVDRGARQAIQPMGLQRVGHNWVTDT